MREDDKKEKFNEVPVLNTNDNDNKNNDLVFDLFFGLTLPGRVIMTLYSFHGLFFIYNLIIQYIILIPGLLYNIKSFGYGVFLSIIYIVFAISSSNILIIPSFEFLSFPFLLYRNPKCHIVSFIYIYQEREFNKKQVQRQNCIITNILFIIIEILYTTGLILGYISKSIDFKDIIKQIILVFMYLYYLTIIFCYFMMSAYLIVKIFSKECCCSCFKFYNFGQNIIKRINLYFEERPDIPEVNLFSYLINPFLKKYYKKNDKFIQEDDTWYFEDFIYGTGIIIKLILIPISMIFFISIFKLIFESFWLSSILFVLLFISMTILSVSLNFPFLYRNRKTYGTFGCCCNCCIFKKRNNIFNSNIIFNHRGKHPYILSITRFICDFVIIIVIFVLLKIYYMRKDDDSMENIFNKVKPVDVKFDTKKLLLPNICYSSIHNIPLYLYLPFINDAYYYKNFYKSNINSSLEIKNYKNLFFSDEDYNIDVKGNLVKEKNTVKMVQYNVKNQKNFITILSIKGTSYNTDIYLDAQLYFSSILLNLLSTFSILSTKESGSFKLIEYSLNIPYRIFFRYLMVDVYLNKLKEAYIENEVTFYKNVVIVGHSLGGGLAKLFGRLMRKQAISLSGPGVNAFQSLWNYKGGSENFEISAIDLVPDMDLVPRVEVSGGTVYRIICQAGAADCHSKHLSLCEVLIMCRNPNYEVYCKDVANLTSTYIDKIKKSSELNNDKDYIN